ncbi:unnamed protein product [Urochloa humidicola]
MVRGSTSTPLLRTLGLGFVSSFPHPFRGLTRGSSIARRAGVPMEIMCLMFGEFVDDYAVKDFCTPNARLYGRRPNKLLTARGDSGVIEQSISYLGFWSIC